MEHSSEPKCYVCNTAIIHTAPEMILWNGTTKKVCSSCYKCVEEGIAVYQERNPDWQRPTRKYIQNKKREKFSIDMV